MSQKNSETQTFTYQGRPEINDYESTILLAFAELMNKVEHCLFADLAKGGSVSALKPAYLRRFNITARQFNSARAQVGGRISSIKELQKLQIADLKRRISSLESTIKKLERGKCKEGAPRKSLHGKKRRLTTLSSRLIRLEQDYKLGKTPLCFGSRKLFRAQFALNANNYASHEEWRDDWKKARSNSFFLIGSKDETNGNQSCVATVEGDTVSLRIRLPDALAEYGKYLVLKNIRFDYGHEAIVAAILSHSEKGSNEPVALSYRLLHDEKGWRVFVNTPMHEPPKVTRQGLGVIGLDINANHLAVVETDRFGNPIARKVYPLCTYGKTQNQAKALIGDVAKSIITWCLRAKKPVVLEKLVFDKKKCELREIGSKKYSRMLSSFSYSSIISMIKARAFRFGVHVKEVNPAYTSIIGRVKFAKRYGFSSHESAALCIGRRSIGGSERLPRRQRAILDGKGNLVTLLLPVRNRDRHVWSSWRQVQKKLQSGACSTFPGACERSSSKASLTCCDSTVLDFVGETPAHESTTELLGCRV